MDARRLFYISAIGIGILCPVLVGCETVHLPDVTEPEFRVLEDETRVFQRASELSSKIEASGIIYNDPRLQDYLTQILRRLWPDQNVPNHINLEVRVINDTNVNAYALPTGRVYLNSAALALMRNEDQLVSVLAHELVHIIERHALKVKRSTSNKAAWFNSVNILSPISSVAAISSITGYSRDVERRADERGLELMRMNGYDPREALRYYERIYQYMWDEDIEVPMVFASHPGMDDRIGTMRLQLRSMDLNPNSSRQADEAFLDMTRAIRLKSCRQWLRAGQTQTALAVLNDHLSGNERDVEAMVLKAQILRRRAVPQTRPGRSIQKYRSDYALALEVIEAAIRLDSQYAPAWFERGVLMHKTKDAVQAKESWRRYLSLEPTNYRRAFIEELIHDG